MTRRRPPNRPVSDEDSQLFRDAIGEVKPVDDGGRVRHRRAPPPEPRLTRESEARVRDELLSHAMDPAEVETGEELAWIRPGLQHRYLQRLRRGHYSVTAEIDLHEMNQDAARTSLHDFLDECRRWRCLCARIVHGKGLRSRAGGPVLKNLVNSLLRRRNDVLAFASAPPHDGGTGAVYVLLQRP